MGGWGFSGRTVVRRRGGGLSRCLTDRQTEKSATSAADNQSGRVWRIDRMEGGSN